ncbi:MAG: hypothetical protein ACLUOI_08635 [Eisenbergiella sp.]
MKKKILSIFLAAAMTFGLTACGSSGDTTAAPESAEPAVTEASSASGETPEADAGEEKERNHYIAWTSGIKHCRKY